MRLFDGGRAPNPRRVTVFLKEKGIAVETVPVDMGAFGHIVGGDDRPQPVPAAARARTG